MYLVLLGIVAAAAGMQFAPLICLRIEVALPILAAMMFVYGFSAGSASVL